MNIFNNTRFLIFFAFLTISFYLWPLFAHWDNVAVPVFDNLDGKIIQYKLLAESGMIFADSHAVISNMMNGLPRLSYGSEFNYLVWLFVFFKPISAYIINEILMHIVALFSMITLLYFYFIPHDLRYRNLLVVSLALLFAYTPFWIGGGLSIPLMPLTIFALLRIRERANSLSVWIILFIIPFFSNFLIVYIFFLLLVIFLAIIEFLYTKQPNIPLILAIFFMGVVFLFIEYRIIDAMFFDSAFVSHRTEFIKPYVSLNASIAKAGSAFAHGEVHSIFSSVPFIVGIIVLAVLLSIPKRQLTTTESVAITLVPGALFMMMIPDTAIHDGHFLLYLFIFACTSSVFITSVRSLMLTLVVQIVIAAWYALWFYEGIQPLAHIIPFIETFNMSRFYFVSPPLWIIMLGLAFTVIFRKSQIALPVLMLFWTVQAWALADLRTFVSDDKRSNQQIAFRKYYAEALFQLIEKDIGNPKSSFRIVSLCIDPAVSLFNGFYTLDGYSTNYPLLYKHRFRKIITETIENNSGVKKIFDHWGSKCYFFASTCGYDNYYPHCTLNRLEANLSMLYAMGGRYIISGYTIATPEQFGLKYVNSYSAPDQYWDVHLYQIMGVSADES